MAAEKASSKAQAWFCTTGLPSDIVIEVSDMTFHLHKFPLMSKSRKLHQLITEQETNPTNATIQTGPHDDRPEPPQEYDDDEIQQVQCRISLPDFPGGSAAFEAAAKFCYGVKIEISASTVAALRCAADFLEMTEDFSEDNLVSRTERFLSQTVLTSLKDSIRTLKSCEPLMPMAEALEIPQRCIDSIASRACSADPSLLGWPLSDGGAGEDKVSSTAAQILWNGIEANRRRRTGGGGGGGGGKDSWLEDLSLLSLPLFNRLILAMRSREVSADIVESCVMCYATRSIPGISRSSRKPPSSSSSSSSVASENEQRELLETIITNLPSEKSTRSAATTKFLFGLLRTANILNASEASRAALERKIGSQLELATLDDLLIPSYSYLKETLYDVDCVERILAYFLEGERERSAAGVEGDQAAGARSAELMLVGKLIDGYLAEIASDSNLKPDKFLKLVVSLPESARLYDDGLYRAVDVYLKAHPWVSEADREKISGVIECQKLTLEACTHAAQNDRLPLRAIVQVLFFEQLQLRHAIAGSLLAADAAHSESARSPATVRRLREEDDEEDARAPADAVAAAEPPAQERRKWRAAVRENQVLRLDMDSMRKRVQELERECTDMKRVIEKIDSVGSTAAGGGGWRNSFARKFGCKFKTQVRDSHEPMVAEARRGRPQQQQQRHHQHQHQHRRNHRKQE